MQIFLSYAREDRECARQIASALQSAGYSVWWDIEIPAGSDFAVVLDEKIRAAKCVVVIWSAVSVRSQWVREEAEIARLGGTLVPVMVDESEPPMGFKALQTLDLRGWLPQGAADEQWQRLLKRVGELVTRERPESECRPAPPAFLRGSANRPSNCEWAGYLAFLLVAAMAVIVFALSLILVVLVPGTPDEGIKASFLGTGLPRQIGSVITVYLAAVFPLAMLYLMVCPQARREAIRLFERPASSGRELHP